MIAMLTAFLSLSTPRLLVELNCLFLLRLFLFQRPPRTLPVLPRRRLPRPSLQLRKSQQRRRLQLRVLRARLPVRLLQRLQLLSRITPLLRRRAWSLPQPSRSVYLYRLPIAPLNHVSQLIMPKRLRLLLPRNIVKICSQYSLESMLNLTSSSICSTIVRAPRPFSSG